MKAIFIATLLASVLVLTSADCGGLSPALCNQLTAASRSLSAAVETSSDELAEAITDAARRSAALYKASLNLVKAAKPTGNARTLDDVAALQAKMEASLQQAQAAQSEVVQEAVEAFQEATKEMQHVLQETVMSASSDSEVARAVAFSIAGPSLEVIRQKLEKALDLANEKLKGIVRKAIEKVDQGIGKLEGFLVKILGQAGVNKVAELLKSQVERILKVLEDAIAKQVASKSQATFSLAVKETETLIEGLEAETRVTKRGIKDVWNKVKAAVSKLGADIRDAAQKAIEKNKPIIMKALKEVGKAVVNAGRDIIIEVVNSAVKAIIPEEA